MHFVLSFKGQAEGEEIAAVIEMSTVLLAENEVVLFKISLSIQTSESDFVSLSESPPAKTVFHEPNWNFDFHLSSVTHLLMSLLPFGRTSGFALLGYFQ